jgi:hypothetical protein
MRLHDCITLATGKGFKVIHDDEDGCWYITTPRASQVLGPYQHERMAWMDAALLAQMD